MASKKLFFFPQISFFFLKFFFFKENDCLSFFYIPLVFVIIIIIYYGSRCVGMNSQRREIQRGKGGEKGRVLVTNVNLFQSLKGGMETKLFPPLDDDTYFVFFLAVIYLRSCCFCPFICLIFRWKRKTA